MGDLPEIIHIGDLCLRPVAASDMAEVSSQLGDAGTAEWLAAVPHPFGPDDAVEFLDHATSAPDAIRVIERDGRVAGCVCVGPATWYWLDPAMRGQGVMRAALRAAIGAHFERELASPLVATCREDNAPSRALLSALGFAAGPVTRRMHFRSLGGARACIDYVMTAGQWHLLNPARIPAGKGALRPAMSKDMPALSRMLSPHSPDAVWPDGGGEAPVRFMERQRFRGGTVGLMAVEDEHGRTIGFLLQRPGNERPDTLFDVGVDTERYLPDVLAAHGRRARGPD
ncbi:GNAT family N-acetyltransferase [Rhodobacterales bacterium HKCCE2091]|nr:GNAT family N-acetyltransferase [Rhodobacterales bacterium HKCCE2091]